ncbi:hypothetical protein [Thermococcus sp. AM4]|uniref:hypothetical protein n=1 Tax=Thermococcus sp. (strain AM4) TaxID=246969 RepID=UPI0001870423|nr:hypothetical protein [Thermococcus sp. AM4]EEB74920.1 hypothetical protein TAM4_865 [Thermococcus sp. AM4]
MARRYLLATFFFAVILIGALVLNSWYSSYTSLFRSDFPSKVLIENEGVSVEAYLPGDPLALVNATLYHHYDRVTIILGSGDTKDYCDRTGRCQFRTLAAVEVSCLAGKLMGSYYYETAREMGYNDSEARRFALEQVSRRVSSGNWLTFSLKLAIGRGKIGNERHLLIILRGPLDGAVGNRIYVPRKGVLVLEALDDKTLYREALLIEGITGISCSKG